MVAQAYKRVEAELDDNWDAIVIGSGIGGLATASLLAQHDNQKVLVLERHYVEGGYTHTFKRPGFEWDVGVHYIGDVQKGTILNKVFDGVGDGSLEWADMGPVYDRIYIGDEIFDFPKGRENFRAMLKEKFPNEHDAIDRYLAIVKEAIGTSLKHHANKALPGFLSSITSPIMSGGFNKWSDRTVRDVLEELTSDQKLIAVITGQFGDYGLPPSEASFVIQAMIANHYFEGGYYPVGGSDKIPKSILPMIEAKGGMVLVNAEVESVVIEGNKAVGVKMAKDGRVIKAKKVVSGAGVNITYGKLIPEEVSKKHGLQKKLATVKPSVGHVCLYIGLNKTADELNLPKYNYWIYPNEDHEASFNKLLADFNEDDDLPLVYISFPGAKDPTYSTRFPGHSAIDIITAVPYEWFEQWEGTRWKKRPEEYDAFKAKITQKILDKLFEHMPELEEHIEIAELSTPLTTKHFCNYEFGELYGIDHDPDRFRQRWLRPQTPIKNFYLTGQDILTAGVAGALFAGVLTASSMTNSDMVSKIMKSKRK